MERRSAMKLAAAVAVGAAAAAGAGLLLVENEVLPGRAALQRKLGGCDVDYPTPAPGVPLITGSFPSALRRTEVRYALAYPPGYSLDATLPVCVLLHGLGWRERGAFDALWTHRYLAEAVKAGESSPFVLAACDGGGRFWHRRSDGEDPAAMVTEEFLPLLARRGLKAGPDHRPGLMGWSMGGFGALSLAIERPGRWAGVVAMSPAVWRNYDESGNAFDSAPDFAAHDVLKRSNQLRSSPVRVYCGEYDPFVSGNRELAKRLPGVVRFSPGCHGDAYWRRFAPSAVRFLGRAMANAGG